MKILETDRLFLRPQNEKDLDDLCLILSDRETMKYYPKPYSREETANWIQRTMHCYARNGFGLWAVILKENGRFIGQCGISPQDIDGETVPEIGYHIHKDYWNRGYATEAAAGCLRYGFETLQLPRIYIHTSIENMPSQRVAEKLSMLRIKEYDKPIPSRSAVMRHVVYALDKKVWEA